MAPLRSWCWDHSLSLFWLGVGTVLNLVAAPVPAGKVFDYLITYGASFTVLGLWGLSKGPLKEVNREDKEPVT